MYRMPNSLLSAWLYIPHKVASHARRYFLRCFGAPPLNALNYDTANSELIRDQSVTKPRDKGLLTGTHGFLIVTEKYGLHHKDDRRNFHYCVTKAPA